MIKIREDLKHIEQYKVDDIHKRNLAENENRVINWDPILKEMFQNVQLKDLSYYGDNKYTNLKKAAADYFKVKESQIVQGVGSDQLINTIITSFVNNGETFFTVNPDFFMYDVFCEFHGAKVKKYDIDLSGDDIKFDADEFLSKAKEANAKVVMFSNPNNPLSVMFDRDEVEKVIANFDGLIVLDEAYLEFTGVESFISLLDKYDNLVILRTLSKAFGLAGLRLGFSISSEELAIEIDKGNPDFSMSNLVARVGEIALKNSEVMFKSVEEIKNIRDQFIEFLKEQNFKVMPSKTNFVTFQTPLAKKIYEDGADKELRFKFYPDGMLKDYLRIAIGTKDEMDELIEIIKNIVIENQ